jgi:hypothetical protein
MQYCPFVSSQHSACFSSFNFVSFLISVNSSCSSNNIIGDKLDLGNILSRSKPQIPNRHLGGLFLVEKVEFLRAKQPQSEQELEASLPQPHATRLSRGAIVAQTSPATVGRVRASWKLALQNLPKF